MTNAGSRWNNAEAAERLLTPFQKYVAFMVTFHLQTDVFAESIVVTKVIDGNGVVNDEVYRGQGVNLSSIAPETLNGFTHGSQIHNRWYAGEILHQHPGRAIGNFSVCMSIFQPPCQSLDVLLGNRVAILPAQEVFQ